VRYLRLLVADAAEDVAAEVWLQVVRTLGHFSGDEQGLRGWIYTIARYRVIDLRRRAIRCPVDPAPVEQLADIEAEVDAAEAALEAISTRAALALIATLPPDQAEVIMLRVVGGLDVATVARIMGKKPGTVRVSTHRGLRRLAERLASRTPRPGRV
jgi:RNA polymerase sigma-70 factor (ECF subfamily)